MANEQGTQPKRKSARAAAEAHAPWLPTKWEAADALSMRRFAAGTATAVEQKRAFAWILKCCGYSLAGYENEPYRPGGEDGRRETDFALGKANVGRQIEKLVHIDLSQLRGNDVERP